MGPTDSYTSTDTYRKWVIGRITMILGSSVHCTPMFGNYLGLAQFTSPQHSTIYLFPWLNCDLKVVFFFHKRLYRESVTRTPNQPWPVYRQYIQPHSGFLGNSRILISAVFTPSTRPELPASL